MRKNNCFKIGTDLRPDTEDRGPDGAPHKTEPAPFARQSSCLQQRDHISNPARLVGLGFRYWVRGMQTARSSYYDLCCQNYIQAFGPPSGIVLATRLGHWVDALDQNKKRAFQVYDQGDEGFSYDEVVAISMVAASQHADCPALKACLYAITRSSDLDFPMLATREFAHGLIDAGQIIEPHVIAEPLATMAEASPARAN